MKMKKWSSMAAVLAVCALLTACADNTGSTSSSAPAPAQKTEAAQAQPPAVKSKILIAYFSYGEIADIPAGTNASTSASIQPSGNRMTGNTGLVAEYIQQAIGGDLFSIQTVEKYPSEYRPTVDQGERELRRGARPALASHVENIQDYDVIFLGYPNWWSDMPMAVYSFLDEYDLSGKTIIPFCTSGGSALSSTVEAIRKAEPNATVLEGHHISGSQAPNSQRDVQQWVQSLGIQ